MTDQSMTPEQTCLRGLELAERFTHYMIPGHAYTAETMCGKKFWMDLDRGMPSRVGETIALAVAAGDLHLRVAYVGTDGMNRYELPYDEPEQESETDIDPKSIKPSKRKSK
jgi:hypothetical protein